MIEIKSTVPRKSPVNHNQENIKRNNIQCWRRCRERWVTSYTVSARGIARAFLENDFAGFIKFLNFCLAIPLLEKIFSMLSKQTCIKILKYLSNMKNKKETYMSFK